MSIFYSDYNHFIREFHMGIPQYYNSFIALEYGCNSRERKGKQYQLLNIERTPITTCILMQIGICQKLSGNIIGNIILQVTKKLHESSNPRLYTLTAYFLIGKYISFFFCLSVFNEA